MESLQDLWALMTACEREEFQSMLDGIRACDVNLRRRTEWLEKRINDIKNRPPYLAVILGEQNG